MDTAATPLLTALLITAGVVGLLILYFAAYLVAQQRKRLALQRQYLLDETSLLEGERSRIARDIHDELGPILTTARMELNSLYEESGAHADFHARADAQLEALTGRLRAIAVNLTPGILTRKGLEAAIKHYLDLCGGRMRFEYSYEVNADLPPDYAIHIYRTVQEIVHNALKHSGAEGMTIRIVQKGKKLYLSLADNGSGFPEGTSAEESAGLGLRSIRSRVAMLGGRMDSTSKPGEGVDYFIELPINPAYANQNPHRRRPRIAARRAAQPPGQIAGN